MNLPTSNLGLCKVNFLSFLILKLKTGITYLKKIKACDGEKEWGEENWKEKNKITDKNIKIKRKKWWH